MWESGKDPTTSDVDAETIVKSIELDDDIDIDDPDSPEEDENTVIVNFYLCGSSKELGYLPGKIKIEKETNVILDKNYISYNNGVGKVVAGSGIIAKYYREPTHGLDDSGLVMLENITENTTIYIEFSN